MLVVTLGDPYSTNIELFDRAWSRVGLPEEPPTVLVGSHAQWMKQRSALGRPSDVAQRVSSWTDISGPGRYFLDVDPQLSGAADADGPDLPRGIRGEVSVHALETLRQAPEGRPLAVVTGPIDKSICRQAGFSWPGHTEYFEWLWSGRAVMTLAGPRLRVGLVTTHVPLAQVASSITQDLVVEKLRLFRGTLREVFGVDEPRVAVCGLNPHASDNGLFGSEEAEILAPAIERVKREDPQAAIFGPLPADTVFYQAWNGRYDGVLAMYHDQALGPLKTVHFDDAVNVSGGLRHLRVSPDHGPAQDLFQTGRASPRSWEVALETAKRYLQMGRPS